MSERKRSGYHGCVEALWDDSAGGIRKMINYGQLVKVATPMIKQAGKFIKSNPHYLIEGLLGGGFWFFLDIMLSWKKYKKINKLVENQLKKDQAIINDFSSKAQKVDRLEKCNEPLMDALIKKSPNIVGV